MEETTPISSCEETVAVTEIIERIKPLSIWFEDRYRIRNRMNGIVSVMDVYYDSEDSRESLQASLGLSGIPGFMKVQTYWWCPSFPSVWSNLVEKYGTEDPMIFVQYENYDGTLEDLFGNEPSQYTLTLDDIKSLLYEIILALYSAKVKYGYSTQGSLIRQNIAFKLVNHERTYSYNNAESIVCRGRFYPMIMDTPQRKFNSSDENYKADMVQFSRQIILRIVYFRIPQLEPIQNMILSPKTRRPPTYEDFLSSPIVRELMTSNY